MREQLILENSNARNFAEGQTPRYNWIFNNNTVRCQTDYVHFGIATKLLFSGYPDKIQSYWVLLIASVEIKEPTGIMTPYLMFQAANKTQLKPIFVSIAIPLIWSK